MDSQRYYLSHAQILDLPFAGHVPGDPLPGNICKTVLSSIASLSISILGSAFLAKIGSGFCLAPQFDADLSVDGNAEDLAKHFLNLVARIDGLERIFAQSMT